MSFLMVRKVKNMNTDSSPVLQSILVVLLPVGITDDAPYSTAKSNVYPKMVFKS